MTCPVILIYCARLSHVKHFQMPLLDLFLFSFHRNGQFVLKTSMPAIHFCVTVGFCVGHLIPPTSPSLPLSDGVLWWRRGGSVLPSVSGGRGDAGPSIVLGSGRSPSLSVARAAASPAGRQCFSHCPAAGDTPPPAARMPPPVCVTYTAQDTVTAPQAMVRSRRAPWARR